MKKFMAIVMCLAMALSMMTVVSFAADEPTFALTSASAAPGEEVTLTLSIANNPGITALQVSVGWDATKLELTGKTDERLFGKGSFSGKLTINPFNYNWSDDEYDYEENGDLTTYTFKVLETTEDGTYPVTITYKPANIYNAAGSRVTFATVNGAITVKAPVTEPTVEETFVDTNPVDGQPAYLCVLQPAGNVTKMGIKCDGYDTFWAYADNEGTFATTTAAVQVIGLKDPTFTTVVE